MVPERSTVSCDLERFLSDRAGLTALQNVAVKDFDSFARKHGPIKESCCQQLRSNRMCAKAETESHRE